MISFYTKALMLLGGFTMLFGIYRGNRKDWEYQERLNSVKLKQLDVEIEMMRLQLELSKQ